jgi:hypothetical protein
MQLFSWSYAAVSFAFFHADFRCLALFRYNFY